MTIQASDLCASVMAEFLKVLGQIFLKKDPADVKLLWIKDDCLVFSSGDESLLVIILPFALKSSFKAAFKILPTTDPGDGSSWLNVSVNTGF